MALAVLLLLSPCNTVSPPPASICSNGSAFICPDANFIKNYTPCFSASIIPSQPYEHFATSATAKRDTFHRDAHSLDHLANKASVSLEVGSLEERSYFTCCAGTDRAPEMPLEGLALRLK